MPKLKPRKIDRADADQQHDRGDLVDQPAAADDVEAGLAVVEPVGQRARAWPRGRRAPPAGRRRRSPASARSASRGRPAASAARRSSSSRRPVSWRAGHDLLLFCAPARGAPAPTSCAVGRGRRIVGPRRRSTRPRPENRLLPNDRNRDEHDHQRVGEEEDDDQVEDRRQAQGEREALHVTDGQQVQDRGGQEADRVGREDRPPGADPRPRHGRPQRPALPDLVLDAVRSRRRTSRR